MEKFVKQEKELLKDAGKPLPRLHLGWHLLNPLLFEGGKDRQDHVSINPPPLVQSERKLVEDLRAFWAINCKSPEYKDIEVCLLRNLPKVGVGMFVRSGFYPDFILWLRNKNKESVRVVFLDPHGLHHEGIVENDRFAAIEKLRFLGAEKKFRKKGGELDGYILAPADTSLDKIHGAKGKTWGDLEKNHPIFRQEGSYIEKIFSSMP